MKLNNILKTELQFLSKEELKMLKIHRHDIENISNNEIMKKIAFLQEEINRADLNEKVFNEEKGSGLSIEQLKFLYNYAGKYKLLEKLKQNCIIRGILEEIRLSENNEPKVRN